jgi:hypothetical protein
MATIFAAVPMMQCFSPARSFAHAEEALRFAENATRQHGVGYAVWRMQNGKLKPLKTFPAIVPERRCIIANRER